MKVALILALILGIVFFSLFGAGGFWPGAIIGLVVSLLLQRSSKKAQPAQLQSSTSPPAVPDFSPASPARAATKPKRTQRRPSLVWHAAGEPITVAGIQIPSGMLYTVDGAPPYPGEPSAINKALGVDSVPEAPWNEMGYYPNYEILSGRQRRTYLDWLAAGRTDKDPTSRCLGYVFLFFYGLERRALAEGDYNQALINESLRLLSFYGPSSESRSLGNYVVQFANFCGWHLGPNYYRQLWPQLAEFEVERPSRTTMEFILANLYQLGEPLDWSMAYRVALTREDCRRSVVLKRTTEQFWELFNKRYLEAFPSGLALQATKVDAAYDYTAANAALAMEISDKKRRSDLRIPNVGGLHRQFAPITDIWNSCIDDLSGFSRLMASSRPANDVDAWLALPEDLRASQQHPLQTQFTNLLQQCPSESGYVFAPAGALASIAGLTQRAKLTRGQSENVAELIQSFGYSFAPDPRLTGLPLQWNQELALFEHVDSPSKQLPGLMRLTILAVALATSDGNVLPEELARFNKLIDPEITSESSRKHLIACQEALCRDPAVAVASLTSIAKRIPPGHRQSVLTVLVHVAAADGIVALDEIKALRRIARAFQLDESLPEKLLREDQSLTGVQVASKQVGSRGQTVPQAPVAAFSLDANRIQQLTAETHEILSVLSDIMDEEDPGQSEDAAIVEAVSSNLPDWAKDLQNEFHSPFVELIAFDSVSEEDFGRIAAKHHLMPDGLFAALNTWSDEALGDFLLQKDDGQVRVFCELLPERISLTQPTSQHAHT